MQKERAQITVALAGLGFGAAFAPIYKLHPGVRKVILCDQNPEILKEAGDAFGIEDRRNSLDEILGDPEIDAVHLVTPIPTHEEQSVAVLNAGKHCACTVPMATTLDGIRRVLEATGRSGKNYMMMETSVYTRHFLYAWRMAERGEFGRIQFLRGAHYQDMEFWPDYWMGLPPMHYATHAISPLLALSGRRALRVHCFGSGVMRPELVQRYGNPYPIETAIFDLGEDLKAEVTRTLFHTAVLYSESFNVYGDRSTFEWQQVEEEKPLILEMGGKNIDENGVVWRGRKVTWARKEMPDNNASLPEAIRRFTVKSRYYDETNPQKSFEAGGGHGGAHPHMVHEFVSSILEGRRPWIDEITAANWTAPGLCAHESAMSGGAEVLIPDFEAFTGGAL
jgi:predicted dehydrogenase